MPQRGCLARRMILACPGWSRAVPNPRISAVTRSTDTTHCSDTSFPYPLIYSTFGTIVSLASVWIVSAQSSSSVLGA